MKTAVEWLWDELECLIPAECQEAYVQAKEMEKKQSERMYSEEEVKDILIRSKTAYYSSIIEWFEQNEKK